ncbi:MAG: hypothetical protein ACFFCQ_16080 [Promethearchaeota archaeon]
MVSAEVSPLRDLHEYLVVMRRIQNFEDRHERSRFHLALGVFGIIALFAGWIEFISHYFLEIDPSQIFFLQSSDYSLSKYPWLVFSTWFIHIAPIATIIVFFTRHQTLSDWKTFYSRAGILWTLSLGSAFTLNGFMASSDNSLIIYIWAGSICLAAFFTPFIIPKKQDILNSRVYFWPLSAISLISGISTLFIEDELRMGVYATILGICLLLVSLGLTWLDQYIFKEYVSQFKQD